MEGTPPTELHVDPKPKVLWSSAKKAIRRTKPERNEIADKENANVRYERKYDGFNEAELNEVEANLHGDFKSSKIPRWLRKKQKLEVDIVQPLPKTTTSSIAAYTSEELLSSIPREYQILRPRLRPPPPVFQDVKVGSLITDYFRRVSSLSRILYQADTPTKDDFYLNVLSSHPTSPMVACATVRDIVIHRQNAPIRTIPIINPHTDAYISSVQWISSTRLAIGTSDANIYLHDIQQGVNVQTITGHNERIGAMAFSEPILSSGSADATICHHDVRLSRPTIATSRGHSQEVCGLSYSPNRVLLASGGNDNMVNLWDARKGFAEEPRCQLTDHLAAVKALAWSPWDESLLATGGGTADKSIKCWNTNTGMLLHSTQTHAQVSALVWSARHKEILSAHGFESPAMILWNYPMMQQVKPLSTRSGRILSMVSNGSHVVSWDSEGTLRQWDVFMDQQPKRPHDSNDENAFVVKSTRYH